MIPDDLRQKVTEAIHKSWCPYDDSECGGWANEPNRDTEAADAVCAIVGPLLEEERERSRQLAQAMWDGEGILGFDLDGNASPVGSLGDLDLFCEVFIRHMGEERHDHDEANDEYARLAKGVRALIDDAERSGQGFVFGGGYSEYFSVETGRLRALLVEVGRRPVRPPLPSSDPEGSVPGSHDAPP